MRKNTASDWPAPTDNFRLRMELFLGIDVGTSGVRTALVNAEGTECGSSSVSMAAPDFVENRPCQDPEIWWNAVLESLRILADHHDLGNLRAVAVDGTSGTLLLADRELHPVTPGYLYNSSGFQKEAAQIEPHAPSESIARGPGSGLARLLFLQEFPAASRAAHALHQADWIAARLRGKGGFSDETNALKTGYDVIARRWPDWMPACGVRRELLPDVSPVGAAQGVVDRKMCAELGWPDEVSVVAGLTDSNAAFLASGASRVGDGVTSLGTTLAIKLLSDRPVSDPGRGVYSHRIGNLWLAGGASNSGGGVLAHYFSSEELARLSDAILPDDSPGLDYYPLVRPGERFPHADPEFPPRLTPRPKDDVRFLHGMLEGIAVIERDGYDALSSLGAPPVTRVFTAGGGAKNTAWTAIRKNLLRRPILPAASGHAAVGTARVAAGLIG